MLAKKIAIYAFSYTIQEKRNSFFSNENAGVCRYVQKKRGRNTEGKQGKGRRFFVISAHKGFTKACCRLLIRIRVAIQLSHAPISSSGIWQSASLLQEVSDERAASMQNSRGQFADIQRLAHYPQPFFSMPANLKTFTIIYNPVFLRRLPHRSIDFQGCLS